MADDVRFTNYRMAAGRIGLVAVLVPMLAGIDRESGNSGGEL